MSEPSQEIDVENEFLNLRAGLVLSDEDETTKILRWARSIQERVEESTIQRCEAHYEILKTQPEIPRLYASKEKS